MPASFSYCCGRHGHDLFCASLPLAPTAVTEAGSLFRRVLSGQSAPPIAAPADPVRLLGDVPLRSLAHTSHDSLSEKGGRSAVCTIAPPYIPRGRRSADRVAITPSTGEVSAFSCRPCGAFCHGSRLRYCQTVRCSSGFPPLRAPLARSALFYNSVGCSNSCPFRSASFEHRIADVFPLPLRLFTFRFLRVALGVRIFPRHKKRPTRFLGSASNLPNKKSVGLTRRVCFATCFC